MVEINEISVVAGMALDKGEEAKYKLSLEFVNAVELGPKPTGAASPSIVYSMEGDELSELVKKFNTFYTRRLILSHMQVIVISEELAEEGLEGVLDFLVREREIRDDFNIVIAKGSEAKEILSVNYVLQKSSSLKLNAQLATLQKEYGGDPAVRLQEFSDAVRSNGKEAIVEVVEIEGDPEKGKEVTNMQSMIPDARVIVTGAGIFLGGNLVGHFSISDVRNFSIIMNRIRGTNYSIPCSETGVLGIRVTQAETDIKITYPEDRPVIAVETGIEAFLNSSTCDDDLSKISTYQNFEKKINEHIEKEIFQTIQKAQEVESDVFGFGEKMFIQRHQQYKKIEDKWPKQFAKADIKVRVKTQLRRAGLEQKTYKHSYKEKEANLEE